MPVPAVDADKRGDAYKKVKPVEGIDEQGLVPDPQVMHVLFARLMAILGPPLRAARWRDGEQQAAARGATSWPLECPELHQTGFGGQEAPPIRRGG